MFWYFAAFDEGRFSLIDIDGGDYFSNFLSVRGDVSEVWLVLWR